MPAYHNPQVAVPKINLNGTNAEELFQDTQDAARLVNEAREAVRKIAPHGRDYIGQPDQFYKARSEWSARLSALDHIIAELELISFGIHQQMDA